MTLDDTPMERPRIGRAPSTTPAELSHVALQLFIEHGFDHVTINEIAEAAGIGRRTFFRYFPTKNELPWGDFDRLLEVMRAHLAAVPAETPLMEALRQAALEFNRFPVDELPYHRQRMEVLLNSPTLVAHSTLRYASWRQVIADFAAERLGLGADSLVPQTIGWTCLGISLSAYEQWLKDDDTDLLVLIDAAFRQLGDTFQLGPRRAG